MFHVIFPLTFITSCISLPIKTSTLYLTLKPISLIYWPIGPLKYSLSMLKTIFEVSFIDTTIYCWFLPIPWRFFVHPWPLVNITIFFYIFSQTLCPCIDPISLIIITTWMRELSFPVWLVVSPMTHINSLIRPTLSSKTITLGIVNFTVICDSRRKFDDHYVILAYNYCLRRQILQKLIRRSRKIFLR